MSDDVTPKLGQLLKDLNHPAQDALSGQERSSQVASHVYNPGFPADEIDNPGGDSETRDVEIELRKKTDLSMTSRQALTDYASEVLQQRGNRYRPTSETRREPSGHTRGGTLERSTPSTTEFTDANSAPTAYSDYFLSNDDIKQKITDKGVNINADSILEIIRKVLPGAESTFGLKSKADKTHSSASDSNAKSLGIQEVLEAYNRYTPGPSTPFVSTDSGNGIGDQRITKGMYTIPAGLLGQRSPLTAKGVTVSDLRKAALELIHRAQSIGGDDAQTVAEQMLAANSPFVGKADDLAANWHKTQAGVGTVGINGLRIRSMKTMSDFPEAFGADDLITLESFSTEFGGGGKDDPTLGGPPRNATSYGTLNSPAEPFNGVAPFGMLIPTIYAILAFGLLAIVLGAITSGLGIAGTNFEPLNAEKPYTLAFGLNATRGSGWAGAEIGQKFLSLFGIPRDWGMEILSMFHGVMLFYGIDINPFQPGAAIADAVLNILMAPGYYALISKRVLQDFEQITRAFDNFTAFGNSVTGSITILLASIEAFFSSFSIKFFLLMNTIGRIAEDARERRGLKAHGQTVMSLREESEAKMPLFPSTRPFMSRFYPHEGPVMNPLSAVTFQALLLQGSDTLGPDSLGLPSSTVRPQELGQSGYRFTTEDVEQIEELIDGEYMPFSIHDLRTNEVISLPAFIESINDDFSANYNSTQPFGRTDPVQIYTNTTRQVSLTFSLVAMGPKDHEYVWYLVNKFVSMVYPQRDKGRIRTLVDDDIKEGKPLKFIQPFSQRIVASPVVRIRVGDTIHSNASISAFAKVFGGTSMIGGDAPDEETAKKQRDAVDSVGKLRASYIYHKNSGDKGFYSKFHKISDPNGTKIDDKFVIKKGMKLSVGKGKKFYQFKTNYDIYLDAGVEKHETRSPFIGFDRNVWKISGFTGIQDEIDAMALGGVALLAAFRALSAFPPPLPPPPIGDEVKLDLYFESNDADEFIRPEYLDAEIIEAIKSEDADAASMALSKFPKKKVFDPDEKRKKEESSLAEDMSRVTADYPQGDSAEVSAAKFLNTKADSGFVNPVVRAFESNKGRGLAGVITQLGLSYFDELWGTTFDDGGLDNALRAPKKITINLSFSPIHDMTLGLNHKGEMFAPSHPVGMLSARKLDERFKVETMKQRYDDIAERAKAGVGFLPETKSPAALELPF